MINGTTYEYKLEDVDIYGRSAFHNPVKVAYNFNDRVNLKIEAAGTMRYNGPTDFDATVKGLFVDPTALNPGTGFGRTGSGLNGVREVTTLQVNILHQDERGMTVEIVVPEYNFTDVSASGRWWQALTITGFDMTADLGYPRLPVGRVLIDLPKGKNLGKATLSDYDMESEGGLYLLLYSIDTVARPGMLGFSNKLNRTDAENARLSLSSDGPAVLSVEKMPVQEALLDEGYPGIVMSYGASSSDVLSLVVFPIQWFDQTPEEIDFYNKLIVEIEYK